MRKLLFLTISTFLGCNNITVYAPLDADKQICKENTDTIIHHLADGWVLVDSFYNSVKYHSVTHQDGARDDFYQWVLVSRISDGNDTLTIHTDGIAFDEKWAGRIISYNLLLSDDIQEIKRHNLAIKRACKDTCFLLSVDKGNVISAEFVKLKPKEPNRPLEDYGLNESDI